MTCSRWLGLAFAVGASCAQVGAAAAGYGPSTNYILKCAGCHNMQGTGVVEHGIPPFPGLIDPFFLDAEGRRYLLHVPGIDASGLSEAEIAGVLNYIAGRWGKNGASLPAFNEAEVRQRRAEPVNDLVALRRQLAERYRKEGQIVAPYPWP